MGFAASQARLLMLTAHKSDLELQLQFINQARLQLANMSTNLFQNGSNLEPGSQESNRIAAATAALQQRDKALEIQARRIDTQHEAINTEIDAVRKVIAKNIEGSFKLMG